MGVDEIGGVREERKKESYRAWGSGQTSSSV